MKLLPIAAFFAAAALTGSVQAQTPTTDKDKISYAIGTIMGRQLSQGIADPKNDINMALLQKAMAATLNGEKLAMTDEQVQTAMTAFQTKNQEAMQAKAKAEADKNAAEGTKYLAANKSKAGIKSTASGLQYQVMTMGKGAMPKETSTVKVHYRGTLLNGTEFDSSYKRNQPTEFPLNGVIKGWTEGLQLMPAGSKFKFFIPENLAYGEQGPPNIGPKQTLIFEVELLEVK